MKNNKGFTLTEVMVVVIIIGILASLSIPYLLGYARDARNDRAKAVLYMIAQGVKNFKTDFPSAALSTDKIQKATVDNTSACVASASGGTPTNLIYCSYIHNIDYDGLKYEFHLGGSCCARSTGAFACMKGADTDPYDEDYCAWVDKNNFLSECTESCNSN